jgi:restriction system protein
VISWQGHSTVLRWDITDLVEAIYRTHEPLPAEIRAQLPLAKVWMLVPDDSE